MALVVYFALVFATVGIGILWGVATGDIFSSELQDFFVHVSVFLW